MIFGSYWLLDLLKMPTTLLKSRSIILEIFVGLKCKIEVTQPFVTLTIAFYHRHTVLEILQKIDKIDKAVRLIVNKIELLNNFLYF
jgi:hypothetical protein